jgi:hypothetical protein
MKIDPTFVPFTAANYPHFPRFIAPKPGKFNGRIVVFLYLICSTISRSFFSITKSGKFRIKKLCCALDLS